MSHNIDSIAYTGEKPWHGLGFEISPDASIGEWRKASGLEWQVDKTALKIGSASAPGLEDFKALVRSDTGLVLNVVKNRYQVVQPEHLLNFFGQLQTEANIKMETLGALSEGAIIWGLARTGREISVSKEDRVLEYVLLATSYDYSMSTVAKRTSVRVVCNNTLQMAMSGEFSGVRGSHAGAFDFAAAKKMVLGVQEDEAGLAQFQSNIRELAKRKVTQEEIVKYFTELFYGDKEPEDLKDNKRVEKKLAEVISIFKNAPGQQIATAQDSAWGLVNAVTYLVDHQKGRTADSRLRSAFFQDGAALKNKSLEAALKLAA